MPSIDTIVVGAGQAGLATSHHLSSIGRDHLVIERGRVAERWRSQRWDSLRLLSPNWMTRLPGWSYTGPDPDGYMSAAELTAHLDAYAASFDAPVHEQTTVERVEQWGDGYRVVTDQATWTATNVVVATGATGRPVVPEMAGCLDAGVHQVTANRYRNPDQLPEGGVLVVGASSSGVQIADELALAGRDVVVAVGSHARMPRRYRGRDVMWWMDRIGMFDTTIDQVPDPEAARRAPSLQLSGSSTGHGLDLGVLADHGVVVAGRLTGVAGMRIRFGGGLDADVQRAERRMGRVLDAVDAHIERHGAGDEGDPDRPGPIDLPGGPGPAGLDLRGAGIRTVLWATGYRPHDPWLRVPVTGPDGHIRQRRGVTAAPGLYVLGLRFLHHRSSNFIDGVGRDARFVVEHLARRPAARVRAAA